MSVTLQDIPSDKPLTLQEACDKFFGGAISVASLRAEARRGNLVVSKIGRAHFVTVNDLNEMIEKCRVKAQAPTSGSTKPVVRGQSSTANTSSALASAKLIAERLRRRSKTT
jgi:hypothetical protein